jgi:hypothetical protein
MAQPTPYDRLYNFTDWQVVRPSKPLPATELDAELNAIELAIDQTQANLALIQRDDGRLANQSVTPESLSTATLALIGQGQYTPRGQWVTATVYAVGDLVEFNLSTYLCITAHTSAGTFLSDLETDKWLLIANAALSGEENALDKFIGTGAQTVFTLSLNYSGDDAVAVYVNGVLQVPTQDYTIVGDTLTFVVAPSAPAVPGNFNVVARGTAVTAQALADAAATASQAALASEQAALASELAAAASELAAANALDAFDDRYLGAKAGDPALDNDGNALLTGALYWNTTTSQLRVYSGAAWEPMAATASMLDEVFSGTGAQTNFTLANVSGSAVNLEVFISGVRQRPSADYTVSNATLTFVVAPPAGTDNIYVRYAQLLQEQSLGYSLQEVTPTDGQTAVVVGQGYTPGQNSIAVYLNGLRQSPGDDYIETNPTTVTFTSALAATDRVLLLVGEPINGITSAQYISYTPAGTGAVATDVQTKLREWVSVLDFGADPTGVADSTAAIQSAHNTGKPIYYPPGTYRMNSQVTLSGVDFIAISESAVIQSGTDGLLRLFQVTDAPNTLVQGLTFDANSLGKGFLYLIGCADAQIRGNEFKNFKNDPSTAGLFHAIQLQYCPNSRVVENIFQNIGEQFGGSGAQPAQYRAITQEAGCDKTIVSDNVFQSVFGGLFLAEFDRWVTGKAYVVNDRVHAFSGSTFSLYRCIANHTSSGANQPPNAGFWELVRSNTQPTEVTTFSGNVCRNIRDNAVYHIEYVKSITITGNSFVSCFDEPIVVVSDSITITGNLFRNIYNKAISLELGVKDIDNVTISGNTFIQDNAFYSIGVFINFRNASATNTVKTLSITGNTFKSDFSVASASYITIRKCDNLAIVGNVFDLTATVANEIVIRAVDTITRGVISNNVMTLGQADSEIFRDSSSGSLVNLTNNITNARFLANTTATQPLLGRINETLSNIYIQEPSNRVLWGGQEPLVGEWTRGDIIWNRFPNAGGVPGWVCVVSGTPGTWKAMANLAA